MLSFHSGQKTYDVYLHYCIHSHDDREFVLDKLLPYLENAGYAVFLSERDMLPGGSMLMIHDFYYHIKYIIEIIATKSKICNINIFEYIIAYT